MDARFLPSRLSVDLADIDKINNETLISNVLIRALEFDNLQMFGKVIRAAAAAEEQNQINTTNVMKTRNQNTYNSLTNAVIAGAILLMASRASAQNLFVSLYKNPSNITEITPGGVQSTFASGLNYPVGLAFDSAGNLFVANSANNSDSTGNITEITPGGVQSIFASGVDPQGLAFNSAGNLFQADYWSGNIYKFTPVGVKSTFASGFSLPISLAFDSAGNLFVGAGWGNNNGYITKITPSGTPSLFASGLYFPSGLAFDSSGNLFEADEGSGNIYKFTPGEPKSSLPPG